MLSELHILNLKLCSKQYNKKFVLHLIVVPQLGGGWRHNYSTKTRQAGHVNEQSMYSLMSMPLPQTKPLKFGIFNLTHNYICFCA
jgi:hypothetical protein